MAWLGAEAGAPAAEQKGEAGSHVLGTDGHSGWRARAPSIMFFTVCDWLATSSSTSNIWLSELVSLTCAEASSSAEGGGQHACAGVAGCQLAAAGC